MSGWLIHDYQSNDEKSILQLITALGSTEDAIRWEACRLLVSLKQSAVPYLIRALSAPNEYTRWEAAKSLAEIKDPAVAPALVDALEDQDNDVRWAAADGLIVLGKDGLIPLLRALIHCSDSLLLRNSAHHVLRILQRRVGMRSVIEPVLKTLDDAEPTLSVPIAAQAALDALQGNQKE